MEISRILTIQVIIVFILIGVGFVLRKRNMIGTSTTKQLTDLLLFVVTPSVLINSYQKEFLPELAFKLFIAFLYAIVLHIIMIVICTLIFKKEETNKYRVNIFSAVYSNCGFMAIPLLSAVLGKDGVFFGSAYLAVFCIANWTHGVCVCSGSIKTMSIKKIILNPGVIGTVVGLILFVLQISLPTILIEPIKHLANLNTPLAMIILGVYLANVDFKKTFSKISIYLISFLRLIIFPIIAVFLAKIMHLDETVATALLITAACPVATSTPLFATRFDLDTEYASELVSVSTIFSIITIPLIMLLA